MTAAGSVPDPEAGGRVDLAAALQELLPATSEAAYDRLVGYGFARRYVAGKVVADVSPEDVGFGSLLLAETADSVAGLTGSEHAARLAREAYPAPNAEYAKVDLPELPYPDGHFDVVVALGTLEDLERPEALIAEARRVLKRDGVLVISAPDKLALLDGYDAAGTGRRRSMYPAEFGELLEAHFESVLLYRQGAVAGGFVFPASGETTGAAVESTTITLSSPYPGKKPPATRSMIAVCGNAGAIEREEPYLLLDRDRRVFDECADRAEDVELLRGEIQQMQETEAQAFLDALRLRGTEIGYLRARVRTAEAEAKGEAKRAERLQSQIHDMQRSTTWRIFEPYRRLRARMAGVKGSGGGRPG